MRDRLIELIRDRCKYEHCLGKNDLGICKNSCEATTALADYLLANGVIVPPCKVGDNLYVVSQMRDKRMLPFINSYEVTSITIKRKSMTIYHEMDGFIKIFKQSDFGKTVFLTREEAERALKEGAE